MENDPDPLQIVWYTAMSMDGRLDFPYEFPKAGRYRVWVQIRPVADASVRTAAFDLDVR